MKNLTFSLILCVTLAVTATFALPQNNGAPPPAPPAHSGTAMRQRLALSRDQQEQIRAINQDRKGQLNAVQTDPSLSSRERKRRSRAIRLDADAKIRGLLNEDQRAEYDEMKRERRERTSLNRQTALPPQ